MSEYVCCRKLGKARLSLSRREGWDEGGQAGYEETGGTLRVKDLYGSGSRG